MKKFFIPFLVIVLGFLMGQKQMEKIYLIPIGEVDEKVLEELKSSLKEKFHLEVVIGESLPKPDHAYNKEALPQSGKNLVIRASLVEGVNEVHPHNRRRRQYHSSPILDNLFHLRPSSPDFGGQARPPKLEERRRAYRVLGVTELDLYVPNLNFIFGQAQMGGRTALISLVRLREEFWRRRPNERLLRERTLKEAVHELGHTFGLEHCPNPKCVMHFSNSLADTDVKDSWFCPECKKKIRQ